MLRLPYRRDLLRVFGAALAGPDTALDPRSHAQPGGVFRWVAFYGEAADEAVLAGYDLVVLDRMFRGDRAAIARRGARVFGYLSLGEINTGDPSFATLDPAAVLAANPAWPEARIVDVRHPAWRALVLDRLVPELVAGGFTGLLLDTLDTPVFLEQHDPAAHRGMRDAAAGLVRAIRARQPRLSLIMNRGYDLLPELARSLDALLAESLITTGDAAGYRWNTEAEIAHHLMLIAEAGHRAPPLPVLSLDYWPPDDESAIRCIYRRQRALGHFPYVATRTLERVVSEPPPR